MTKNYIIHVNNQMSFLFTTDEKAKIKRFISREMGRPEHNRQGTLISGRFVELRHAGIVEHSYKATGRECIVCLANAVSVTWEEAVWNEDAQAWVPGLPEAVENESVMLPVEQQ